MHTHTHSLQSQSEARQANRCAPGHVRLTACPISHRTCYQLLPRLLSVLGSLWHSGTPQLARSSHSGRPRRRPSERPRRSASRRHARASARACCRRRRRTSRSRPNRMCLARATRCGWMPQDRAETWNTMLQRSTTCCNNMLRHITTRMIGSCGAARAIPRQAAARIVIVRCASHGPGQPYRAAQARRGKARPGMFRALGYLGYLGRVRKSKQRPSPRKVHSSSRIRASAVVCVRLDARHTCACALVIPSNASASSRRLQRGLWAQNCTHWGYCRVLWTDCASTDSFRRNRRAEEARKAKEKERLDRELVKRRVEEDRRARKQHGMATNDMEHDACKSTRQHGSRRGG